mmetsp:Transcript_52377/g.131610  ORF Transcript_52377/g.131610 Transcript_52377/m.131610 type:complete len:609 (-) Transcript_52377:47-1873(-)
MAARPVRTPSTPAETFLTNALTSHSRGASSADYDRTVQLLQFGSADQLKECYTALRKCISLLCVQVEAGRTHTLSPAFSSLLTAVLSFNWLSAPHNLAEVYTYFLIDWVSACSPIIPPVQKTLVQLMCIDPASLPPPPEESADACPSTHPIFGYVHSILRRITELAPMSTTTLLKTLVDGFPHKSHPAAVQKLYVQNLIRVNTYCPVLRDRLMALIVEKMVQIDVEIKLEDVIEDEEEGDLVFEVELEQKKQATGLIVSENADKLDCLMEVLFDFIDNTCHEGDTKVDELFVCLLRIFDSVIVDTHKLKYTQFLLFYICRLKPAFATTFLGYLLNKLVDPNASTVNRQTCAAYAGGFIARANYVTPSLVRKTLKLMIDWLVSYTTSHPDSPPDALAHELFYFVTQSVMYILCFKTGESTNTGHAAHAAASEEGGHKKKKKGFVELLQEHGFLAVLQSSLNPLKICLPSILREFQKVAPPLGLEECFSVIQKNKKLVLPTKSVYGGDNQMESYFPFDPYLLRNSSCRISPHYTTWHDVRHGLPSDDESEDNDEEGSDESDADQTAHAEHLLSASFMVDEDLDLQDDFSRMSFTPEKDWGKLGNGFKFAV